MELWHRKFGKLMKVLSPCLIGFNWKLFCNSDLTSQFCAVGFNCSRGRNKGRETRGNDYTMKYVLSTFRDNVENVRSGDSIDSVLSAGASDCRGTDLCVLYADNHDFGYSRRTLAVLTVVTSLTPVTSLPVVWLEGPGRSLEIILQF